MLNDLRYGIRLVTKRPAFALLVVLVLALGIGASTAIFSVVDQVLLRPLPLQAPEALVRIQEQHRVATSLTGATFRDLRERTRTIMPLMAYRIFTRNLADARQNTLPEQIVTAFVTQDFFAVAAQRPQLGYQFTPDQYKKGAPTAVILGDGLWRSMFAADPNIVGQIVLLHGAPATVAGVMPRGFNFPQDVQAWVPLTEDEALEQNRRAHLFTVIGRLKPGVSKETAQAELQTIAASIEKDSHNADPGISLFATGLQDSMVASVRPALLFLLFAAGLVLLIACANVVNLLLSRAVAQQKEIATRIALGATRRHIVRKSLGQSLLLALAGGLLGCLLGWSAVRLIVMSYPGAIPRLHTATLDWWVMMFAVVISVTSAVIAGVLPALQLSRIDPLTALSGAGRSTEKTSRSRLREALLVCELALATVLLAGAGLLIRSFLRVQQVNPGYDATNIALVPVTLPGAKYPGMEPRLQFVAAALENLAASPGVRSVAAAGVLPLHPAPDTDFELAGKPFDPKNEPTAFVYTATADYFKTMSIPLLAGRVFTAQDTASAPSVVLIDQTMADRYYPGENPIGRMITMKDWGDPLPAQIVGVVGTVRQDSLESVPKPAVYFSFAQFREGTLVTYLLAKTETKPQLLVTALRERIWSVDKQIPVQVSTMEAAISESLLRRRFMLTLLTCFAGLALLLATAGLYGVISYSVSQRTREFGIRLAVGARRSRVLRMVLVQSLRISGIGLGIGILGALATTRMMQSLLYEVSADDPLTLACITGFLLVIAILASLMPALRAIQVDPVVTLRYE
jgi:putative ABC transport system permease protein